MGLKRVLGLDLGTNSIGWALVEHDFDNKEGEILGMGSRIIPMSQDILGEFGRGNSVSQTAERTGYRGARRLRERHLLRRERLYRVLNVLGFLPKHYADQIDFTKRFGKFINHAEPKISFDKDFLFKESFKEMLEDFTKNINAVFSKYEVNTCIRKIHFLAQCYHETQRFTLTYEENPSPSVSGGPFYRGRGLIQLTHDYNYLKLQQKVNDNSSLSTFVPRVAQEIDLACQASGYYWKNLGIKKVNINLIADKDDILTVSKEINGYKENNVVPNGYNDRVLFTNLLKEIFDYEKCKNNK